MKKTLAFFIVICVFSWLLPLGVFMKPSQEKIACGGKRAFHQCTVNLKTQVSVQMEDSSVKISNGTGQNPKSSSASGGNHDYPLPLRIVFDVNSKFMLHESSKIVLCAAILSVMEPIPKTTPQLL